MFRFLKSKDIDPQTLLSDDAERRASTCRRRSFDTKYLGLGKCIDRRQKNRRQSDRFDREKFERLCQERLGPGWL
jgi:hypothetical protein